MNIYFKIHKLDGTHLSEALFLVKKIFEEFDAPDYTEEGVLEFFKFIKSESIEKNINDGSWNMWAAFDGEKIIGIIAAREPAHITLLFVDKEYFRNGIAKFLTHTLINFYKNTSAINEITVNSSPYAEEAYLKLGFKITGKEECIKGIKFIPMNRTI